MRAVIGHVDRRIKLKIARDVARETDRGRVTRSALEIDLHPPGLIEIVGVTEDGFVAVTDVDCSGNEFLLLTDMGSSGDEFLMLGVVTGLDIGLRIDVHVR